MFGILGLGFLLGMQHALEADHIAGSANFRFTLKADSSRT
jgi:high-affinity nickel permease